MEKADPQATLLPEGEYRAMFIRRENACVEGQKRWVCRFQIVDDGPYQGAQINRYYNVPKKSRLPRSHNMFRDYAALIGRIPPKNLKPDAYLKGCVVRVEVKTVRRMSDGKRMVETPEGMHYSKIDRIIGLDAGWPDGVTRPPTKGGVIT